MSRIKKASIDVEALEPFPPEQVEVLSGTFVESMHLIRDGATDRGMLQVGVSVMEPGSTVRYRFEGDHTVVIVEGDVRVELDDGEAVDLRTGDVASFPKGALSVWTVNRRTREVFVISG